MPSAQLFGEVVVLHCLEVVCIGVHPNVVLLQYRGNEPTDTCGKVSECGPIELIGSSNCCECTSVHGATFSQREPMLLLSMPRDVGNGDELKSSI